jgi:drug/metabolite transporter (DMT)-like permease
VTDPPETERRPLLPYVLLVIVVAIWASNNIVSKLLLQEMSPPLLALIRFSLAALLFHLPLFLIVSRLGPPLRPDEWRRFGVVGILGQASSTLLFTIGISMVSATEAGLMIMTGPLWTVVLAALFLGEHLGGGRAVGMMIAFIGAGALVTDGQLAVPEQEVMWGSGLLLIGQLAWGGYTLMAKPLLARRSPLLLLAAANLFATAALWPATALLGAWWELPSILTWSAVTWLGVAYLVIFTSAVSQVLYSYGLRAVSASEAISFMYLQPIFTAVLAAFFLDERPTVLTFVCGALILLGLWLVNRPRRPMAPEPRRGRADDPRRV